jgi:HlyD family secretion protein
MMIQIADARRGGLALLLIGALLVSACGTIANAQSTTSGQTATVQRGDIETTISAGGTVMARADANLTVQGGGTIKEVHIAPGDRVKAGQRLITVEDRELKLKVSEAEVSLASAQARYDQAKAGATEKDIVLAEEEVRSAEARYQQTVKGTTTPQDIANAQANLRSAEARLSAVRAGTTTPEDIASAEATLREAEAKYADLAAGAKLADVETAERKVNQARDNRAKTESQLSNSKEQARIAVEQAVDSLRSAQSAYGASKLIYDEAVRTGKDPNVPSCPPTNKKCNDLTDSKLRQYKSDFEAKQVALSNAEQSLEARRLSYEDAKKQEIAGLQTADNEIVEAEAALETVKAGPAATELTSAQAAVDKAHASLDKLRQPVKESEIIQAQAAVDQARSNLEKLQRGATAEDLAVAQSSIVRANATLEDLKAGPKVVDIAVALASLKQSEVALQLAQLSLDQATLTAPFDGVVFAVNGVPGQQAATSGTTTSLVTLVDDSQLRIDIRVAESDVARLKLGQEARVTFDALPDRTLRGAVIFIAPKATIEQNVVSYIVTIGLAGTPETAVRPGMTANVAVVTDRKEDVLLVPNRAIRTVGRERVVEVRYKGLTFGTPVQVGMTGDANSEIMAGLKEGDTVVINTQPTNRVQVNIGGPGGGPGNAVRKGG